VPRTLQVVVVGFAQPAAVPAVHDMPHAELDEQARPSGHGAEEVDAVHVPLPLHVPAAVNLFVAALQDAAWHSVALE
jgi:hypothetical protein